MPGRSSYGEVSSTTSFLLRLYTTVTNGSAAQTLTETRAHVHSCDCSPFCFLHVCLHVCLHRSRARATARTSRAAVSASAAANRSLRRRRLSTRCVCMCVCACAYVRVRMCVCVCVCACVVYLPLPLFLCLCLHCLACSLFTTPCGHSTPPAPQVNGTACAVPRMIVAIMETFQRSDGDFDIPPPLLPFMPHIPTATSQ